MLLKSLNIVDLFGTFNYQLDFTKKNGLMVITGLNGYGKTTILRIISSLSSKDGLFFFYEIPFKTIRVNFDNATRLVISKIKNKEDSAGDEVTDELQNTKFTYYKGSKQVASFVINHDKYITSDYYESVYKTKNKRDEDSYRAFRWWPTKLEDEGKLEKLAMNLSVLNTTMISSQRLYNEDIDGGTHRSINVINRNMSARLENAYLKYMENAQILDGHQIDELLADNTPLLSEEEYVKKASELNLIAQELVSYNLLPQVHIRPFNPAKPLISSVYLNTLAKKIEKYDDIRLKLRLFLDLLNNKHFVNKRFSFSRREGLRVLLKTGGVLKDLTNLSSGEQNEIYLLFKFIFEVPEKSVLLIDEPELSLHVAWQLQFIRDIKEITKTRDIQIVIATHSPEIVSESMDNCVDLTEMTA